MKAQKYSAPAHDFELEPHFNFDEFSFPANELHPLDEPSSSEGGISKDYSHEMIDCISEMLMEEDDLVNQPCMLHDSLALQATEKFLYDLLNKNYNHHVNAENGNSGSSANFVDDSEFNSDSQLFGYSMTPYSIPNSLSGYKQVDVLLPTKEITQFFNNDEIHLPESQQGVKAACYMDVLETDQHIEDVNGHYEVQMSNKQLASNIAESETTDMYDSVLLCSIFDSLEICSGEADTKKQLKGPSRGRAKKGTENVKEVVDLRSLLVQCVQAVANYDIRMSNDLLMSIRKHSSPLGDGYERLAHYFANALEARAAGTGSLCYAGFLSKKISAEILKSYKTYLTVCPFRRLSNVLANKTINKIALEAGSTSIHIIDFGISYGYQWTCLIHMLSVRPSGPPKLKITGIDFPQPGFYPANRVSDTCNRLKKYCERFGVPFEYNVIAQKWENVKIEDLKIEKNELLIVNSVYRFRNVSDETETGSSPRDDVLSLIKNINPIIFIHGTVNGNYSTPYFATRFREALFYYSSMFDMFEATLSREDQSRVMFEKEVLGRDIMNIISCEGTERVERPETYKQWQFRFKRAGFKQLSLNKEIMESVRHRLKMGYNKDFSVDEDGKWMLQGWKGRVIHTMSLWQPISDHQNGNSTT